MENNIEYFSDSDTAICTFESDLRMRRNIFRLAKKYPNEVNVICDNSDVFICRIPRSWIRILPKRGEDE
jgi:hypothetical protein